MAKSRSDRTVRTPGLRRAAVTVAIGISLALVAAFVVSAIADVRTGPPTAGPVPSGDPADGGPMATGPTLRVEVLNGAGTAGLARVATHQLRGDGFDVVFFGNAGRFDRSTSVVLARSGDLAGAMAVAAALGIDSVASEPDPGLLLDVSVVLGADWPPPPPPPPVSTDRIRTWLTR